MAKMMRAGWAGLALLAATLSYAADSAAPDNPFSTGKAQDGGTKTAVCTGCHGPNGNSSNPEWPRLAGQSAVYIAEQENPMCAWSSTARCKNLHLTFEAYKDAGAGSLHLFAKGAARIDRYQHLHRSFLSLRFLASHRHRRLRRPSRGPICSTAEISSHFD